MARHVVTETVEETTEPVVRTERVIAPRSTYYRTTNLIYVVFSLLELLLLFRFVFLLLGANSDNGFVNVIYVISNLFVVPFYGIFGQVNTNSAVFDPATLIAMVMYAIVAWVILRLVAAANNRPTDQA